MPARVIWTEDMDWTLVSMRRRGSNRPTKHRSDLRTRSRGRRQTPSKTENLGNQSMNDQIADHCPPEAFQRAMAIGWNSALDALKETLPYLPTYDENGYITKWSDLTNAMKKLRRSE